MQGSSSCHKLCHESQLFNSLLSLLLTMLSVGRRGPFGPLLVICCVGSFRTFKLSIASDFQGSPTLGPLGSRSNTFDIHRCVHSDYPPPDSLPTDSISMTPDASMSAADVRTCPLIKRMPPQWVLEKEQAVARTEPAFVALALSICVD